MCALFVFPQHDGGNGSSLASDRQPRPTCFHKKAAPAAESKPNIALLFFSSVNDDTDTVLIHGYKYPSSVQVAVENFTP